MLSEIVLELKDLNFSYVSMQQPIDVLTNLNLKLKIGEQIALIGRSGAGKSTLLNIIAGLLHPVSGQVFWNGILIGSLSDKERTLMRLSRIGIVYQFHHLLPEFSAIENVMIPLVMAGKNIIEAQSQARLCLASLGLDDRAAHRPGELSGGEKQRVAIARAIAVKPAVLLMDEPTGNLDEDTADHVMDVLFNLSSKLKLALVIVTHDRRVSVRANRHFELLHGRLTETVKGF